LRNIFSRVGVMLAMVENVLIVASMKGLM